MSIMLPPLPCGYDALEPVITSATMKLHHGAGAIFDNTAVLREMLEGETR